MMVVVVMIMVAVEHVGHDARKWIDIFHLVFPCIVV